MKPLERVNLINAIAVELQQRMTYRDIDIYLSAYGLKGKEEGYGSKRIYVQTILETVSIPLIIKIGEELGLYKSSQVSEEEDSRCWVFGYLRMFISHLTANKDSATNLKVCLSEYAISGFVAHEDIEPSSEWMREIERGLFSMDSLCAIITPDFIKSTWCDQEVGVAIGRKVLVVPIRKGADPYGLFGKYQGIQSEGKNADQIAEEIFKIVSTNDKSKTAYSEIVRNLILNAKSTEDGLKWLKLMDKISSIDVSIISDLHSKFASNSNLNDKAIFTTANKIFTQYGLTKINVNIFVSHDIDTDDLPF